MIISQVSYRTNGPLVGDLRFNVRSEHVLGCWGSEGGLVAGSRGGMHASQGTF